MEKTVCTPWEQEEKVIKKTYKIRSTGSSSRSLETTIPREAFEREVRRLGIQPEDALENLVAVWRFNNFPGLHLSFEHIPKRDDKEQEVKKS